MDQKKPKKRNYRKIFFGILSLIFVLFISSQIFFPTHEFHSLFKSYLSIFLSWQIILFAIFLLFKKEVGAFIDTIQEIVFKNVSIKRRLEELSEHTILPSKELFKSALDLKDKYGDLFWSGHDLRYAMDSLALNGDRANTLRGVTKSLQHIGKLGFSGLSIFESLDNIRIEIESIQAMQISPEKRLDLVGRLANLTNSIGRMIESKQEGYEP